MGKVALPFVLAIAVAASAGVVMAGPAVAADQAPLTEGQILVSPTVHWAGLGDTVAANITAVQKNLGRGVYVEYLDTTTAFPLGLRQSLIRALIAHGVPVAATRTAADYRLSFGIQTMYTAQTLDPLNRASQQVTVTLTGRSGKIYENEFATGVPEEQAGQIDPGRPAPPDYYAWTGDASPTTRIIPINRSFNK